MSFLSLWSEKRTSEGLCHLRMMFSLCKPCQRKAGRRPEGNETHLLVGRLVVATQVALGIDDDALATC